ncbi:DMT family transporter [Streptacidiphilus neutrinimicus]|uniref:DMT family transporter n=1 Tax=Streptacidiphilus neutrinimicus TaxID=105420 RepID=UPI0005AA626E|nr:DMT family transporter [Streptacidiphilus neutrinimicus]
MKAHNSATLPQPIAVGSAAAERSGRGGVLLAGSGVGLFSLSFAATEWSLRGFGPWSVVGLRGAIAAVIAAVCLALFRAPRPERRHWAGLATVGLGCVVGFPALTTLALRTTTTAHSAVVIGLMPLATSCYSAARTRSRQPRAFWAAALAGAATVVAFTLFEHGGAPSAADLYLFAALLLCSAGYAEGGRLAREMPGWQVIAWALVAVLPVTAVLAIPAVTGEPVRVSATALAGVLFLGLSQFVSYIPWYQGMALIGVQRAAQIQLAQPLLNLLWAALLLHERIPAAAPIAALLVLACIATTQRAGQTN